MDNRNHGLKGERRIAEVARLCRELPIKPNMTRRRKMDILESYLRDHPDVSVNALCEAAGVIRTTFDHHRRDGKHGDTIYARRRHRAILLIECLHPDKNKVVVMAHLLQELKIAGHSMGINTLRDILRKSGYRISLRPLTELKREEAL